MPRCSLAFEFCSAPVPGLVTAPRLAAITIDYFSQTAGAMRSTSAFDTRKAKGEMSAMYRFAAIKGPAAALLGLLAASGTAMAASSFTDLAGTWRGEGRVQLLSGQSEALSCKAYFTTKDAGVGLGIALACASASNKIDLRAALTKTGEAITGSWEERSFNSTGSVSGTFANERIELAIDGTITATMSITLEGKSQLISIATDGQGFRSVDLELERS